MRHFNGLRRVNILHSGQYLEQSIKVKHLNLCNAHKQTTFNRFKVNMFSRLSRMHIKIIHSKLTENK